VSSTDAAAVFSILRGKNLALKDNLRSTLELESGSNDPMAYVLTISFLSLVSNPAQGFTPILLLFIKQMTLGAILGYLFAITSKWLINSIKLDFEGLYPVLVIALMFTTFSFTDFVGGNGFLAIYICAVYLGNHDFIHKKTILKIFDGFAWLLHIVLFLTLGLLVFPTEVLPYMGVGLAISLFLIFVARPLSVLISLLPFKMMMRRRLYISWVGLRGAVPIVFATYPLIAGIDKAPMIFNLVFFISVTSVLIQGTTLSLFAKWLKVALPMNAKPLNEVEKLLSEVPKAIMKEMEVSNNCAAVDKNIVDLGFPKNAIIAMIKREGRFIIPNGLTIIQPKDQLVILTDSEEVLNEVNVCLAKKGLN
jgi:cell volume regulation protein A